MDGRRGRVRSPLKNTSYSEQRQSGGTRFARICAETWPVIHHWPVLPFDRLRANGGTQKPYPQGERRRYTPALPTGCRRGTHCRHPGERRGPVFCLRCIDKALDSGFRRNDGVYDTVTMKALNIPRSQELFLESLSFVPNPVIEPHPVVERHPFALSLSKG